MAEILFDTYDVVYEIPEVKHNESRFIVYIKVSENILLHIPFSTNLFLMD